MNKTKKENRPIKIRFIFLILFLIISALSLGITISYFIYNQIDIQSSSKDAEKVRKGQLFLNDYSKEVGDSMHREKTIEELAKLKSAIVKIETETSQGSGILIDKSGYLLTNWHVIDGNSDRINVKYHSSGDKMYLEPQNANLIAYDSFIDIALLRVEDMDKHFEVSYLELGDIDEIMDGQNIVVIGSPKGLTNTISEGVISAIRTDEKRTDIQITAPLSEGSSGGALLNRKGQLIGITTYKIKDGENLNFAISLEDIIDFLDREYIKDFSKFTQKKRILGEGIIKDSSNKRYNNYIVYSDNLKDAGSPYISPNNTSEYASEKLIEGNGKIAYSEDGVGFQVADINAYNPHFDASLSFREDPLLNREHDAIPMTLSFMEGKNQIYLLDGNDYSHPDILLISTYFQDNTWILIFMSLENGAFIEWDIEDMHGWTDGIDMGTYIRRQSPNIIEIIHDSFEGFWYKKYEVDYFNNMLIAEDDHQEIYDITPYLNEGGWIKIGE